MLYGYMPLLNWIKCKRLNAISQASKVSWQNFRHLNGRALRLFLEQMATYLFGEARAAELLAQ